MRPIFLTRTQRVTVRLHPLLQVLLVLALFAFIGTMIGSAF